MSILIFAPRCGGQTTHEHSSAGCRAPPTVKRIIGTQRKPDQRPSVANFTRHRDAVVEVHRVECRLPKREMIPRESLKPGDRVQALIKEIDREARNLQVILTRTSPDFLSALFQRVVPKLKKTF